MEAVGGIVVGSVQNQHGANDFTPFIKSALDSKAEVLGLANGHAELIKAMAAMDALGVRGRMKVVGLLTFIDDIHEMGLDRAQGLYLADSWFWTRDDETRAWAHRFFASQQRMPSSLQAADYSAATQFLRAVAATGDVAADPIIAWLRHSTLNDMYVRNGRVRPDGTMLHDLCLLQVKAPKPAQDSWDVYELIDW